MKEEITKEFIEYNFSYTDLPVIKEIRDEIFIKHFKMDTRKWADFWALLGVRYGNKRMANIYKELPNAKYKVF